MRARSSGVLGGHLLVLAAVVVPCVLALAACGAPDGRAAADAELDANEPTCHRAPERDAFCASADVATHAFACPTSGEGDGTALLVAITPDGCGDPTPSQDRFAAVICCP